MQQAIDLDALAPLSDGARVAILRSKWYGEIVQSLYDKCAAVLRAKGVSRIESHILPGCFEFPYAAAQLTSEPANKAQPPLDAIICLGVVLKGDTYHFEMIVDECVRGLGEVSRSALVPIINEVLPVTDIAQAQARAADDEFNKGIEAAAAAIEIIHWQRQLR